MFSANDQLRIRAKKRKVIEWVEERMPSLSLDAGLSILVSLVSLCYITPTHHTNNSISLPKQCMEVQCKAIGCVPGEIGR